MDYNDNKLYINNNNYSNFKNLIEISRRLDDSNKLNKVIKYINEKNGKVFTYNENINLDNIHKEFNDQKSYNEWIVISSQGSFFFRKKGQERWESNIPWLNEENIDEVYNNLKPLAFTKEVDFSHKKYNDIIILGATYTTMEKRLQYLISRLNKINTKQITFLVADDRKIEFNSEIKNCDNKICLDKVFSNIENNSEQKIFYEYFSKIENTENSLDFTTKFKETINSNITEKTMTYILVQNYKPKLSKINLRILTSHADKNSGRPRANTGDTIKTLLTEDKISNINDLKNYAFVSGQPHIETQKIAITLASLEYFNMSEIKDNFSIEVVGYSEELEKTKESIKLHLQTLAGTIYSKYVFLLFKETKDLTNSIKYTTENLSYNAIENLIINE